jgi:hypothetical protein
MVQQSPPDPSKPRSRLEDEVLEILQRADRPPSKVVQFRSRAQRERRSIAAQIDQVLSRVRITSMILLVACLVLAIVAALVSDASPLAGRILAICSIVALVALFVRSWRSPQQPTSKTWRGRDIDFHPSPAQDLWNRFRNRPKGPKR